MAAMALSEGAKNPVEAKHRSAIRPGFSNCFQGCRNPEMAFTGKPVTGPSASLQKAPLARDGGVAMPAVHRRRHLERAATSGKTRRDMKRIYVGLHATEETVVNIGVRP
jgi:hypothetical protein